MKQLAQRTGTQLRADMDAATSALDTAIGNATDSNIAAALTAFATVETNGRDSTYVANTRFTSDGVSFARDIRVLARAAQKELRRVHGNGAQAADRVKTLRRLKINLAGGPWASLRHKATAN